MMAWLIAVPVPKMVGQSSPSSGPAKTQAERTKPMIGSDLDQQLFFCTTRIEAKTANGKETSIGTGFIFSHKIDEQQHILFIVTNRHVVDGFGLATISFVQDQGGSPQLGRKCEVRLEDLPKLVFADPDPKIDIALIPMLPVLEHFKRKGETPFFRALSEDNVLSDEGAQAFSAIQAVLFMGYPIGLMDEKNFIPIARRGITATPYTVDFNGLPVFLVDASVFPGSSGSPVLVLDEKTSFTRGGGSARSARAYFLGLISQAYLHEIEGEVEFKPIPSRFIPTYSQSHFVNIGVVIKAKALLNTISEFLKVHPVSSAPSPSPKN